MKQQTILVTGGAGFVGSVCVELLVAQGYNVIVLDNLQTGNRRAVHPKARLVRGSIGNARLLQRIGRNIGTRHHLNYRCKSVIA